MEETEKIGLLSNTEIRSLRDFIEVRYPLKREIWDLSSSLMDSDTASSRRRDVREKASNIALLTRKIMYSLTLMRKILDEDKGKKLSPYDGKTESQVRDEVFEELNNYFQDFFTWFTPKQQYRLIRRWIAFTETNEEFYRELIIPLHEYTDNRRKMIEESTIDEEEFRKHFRKVGKENQVIEALNFIPSENEIEEVIEYLQNPELEEIENEMTIERIRDAYVQSQSDNQKTRTKLSLYVRKIPPIEKDRPDHFSVLKAVAENRLSTYKGILRQVGEIKGVEFGQKSKVGNIPESKEDFRGGYTKEVERICSSLKAKGDNSVIELPLIKKEDDTWRLTSLGMDSVRGIKRYTRGRSIRPKKRNEG